MDAALYLTLMSGGTAFDPVSLFAKYNASGFYLPFAKSPTRSLGGGLLVPMYQDQAGTPVDADGESIGLAIDESQGAAVGAELVTNGAAGFSGTTGWSGVGTTLSESAGELVIDGSDGSSDRAEYALSGLTVGALYRVEITGRQTVAGSATSRISTFTWGTAITTALSASSTKYVLFVIATATSGVTRIYTAATGGDGTEQVKLSAVSTREIAGNHALQTTASAKPTFKTGSPNYASCDGGDYLPLGLATALTEVTVAACFRGTAAIDIALGRATTGGDVFLGINPSGYLGGAWRTQSWTTIDDDNARDIRGEDVVGLLRANASTVQLWLDGVKVYEAAPAGTAIAADNGWYVGAHNNEGTAAFHLAGRLYQPFMIESYIDDADVVPLMRELGAGVVSI